MIIQHCHLLRFDISPASYLDLDRQSTITAPQPTPHLTTLTSPTSSASTPSSTSYNSSILSPSPTVSNLHSTNLMPPHSINNNNNGGGFTSSIKSDFTPPAPPPPVVTSAAAHEAYYSGHNALKNGPLCEIKSMDTTPPISAGYQPLAPPPMYQR